MADLLDLTPRLRRRLVTWQGQQRLARMAAEVEALSSPDTGAPPVAFFNASTRLSGMSLNAAFSLLSSWSLRLAGTPVVHFVCDAGMSRCVLGADRDDPHSPPPCELCQAESARLYAGADVYGFGFQADPKLETALEGLNVEQLARYEHPIALPGGTFRMPLGALVLPSLRWTLRKHRLDDDEPTRFLFRQYLLSAYRVAQEFSAFLDQTGAETLVVFNGIMAPEASARWVAMKRGVRVITHEVGFRPFSVFFSNGHATAYPMQIPADFELDEAQNAELDAYLENRFQGKFTMAGIQFWPEMRGLDGELLEKIEGFRNLVPIFTNVVFDTSQVHANTVFGDMFEWLDTTLEIIRAHPETLFVMRAHPDEMRRDKESQESVQDWVRRNEVDSLDNVVFIEPQEYISSYELIERAHFVMVYNSSIGLEASLLGAPVLCGGKARYTQYTTVFFPQSVHAYRQQAEEMLAAENVEQPEEHRRHARRFLYYQFFRASLSFDHFIENGPLPGFVNLRPFDLQDLLPDRSPVLRVVHDGILKSRPFFLGGAS